MEPKVSVCIATYNMKQWLAKTIRSINQQLYKNIEIVLYDDCSTDGTENIAWFKDIRNLKYIRGEKNLGVGEAFNQAIKNAMGEYVMTMCADDIIIEENYINDAVYNFEKYPMLGHITRYYYQFTDKIDKPVRAWRINDAIHLANNPSGLLFRKKALEGCSMSNRMFIESSHLVSQVIHNGWGNFIIPYDAIAVRVWSSTSTKPGYYLKRRLSSPVMDWKSIGVDMSHEYVSFIQIKNGFKVSAVIEEMVNFVKIRPLNLFSPPFWFFGLLAIFTPQFILRKIPHLYRKTWGLWTTKHVKRNMQSSL